MPLDYLDELEAACPGPLHGRACAALVLEATFQRAMSEMTAGAGPPRQRPGPGTTEVSKMTAKPAGTTPPPDSRPLPLTISHAEVDKAFDRGVSFPLARAVGWVIRYRGAWWVIYEDGWLRLIKSTVTDQLDQLYPRIAEAEAQAAAEAARERNRHRDRDES